MASICAAILARNMAPTIGATIASLSWPDAIFLYDDGSTDGTAEAARAAATVPIAIERSPHTESAFALGEKCVRNHVLDRAVDTFRCDYLAIVDADEMLTEGVVSLLDPLSSHAADGISFSIWHLWDTHSYLHFWEAEVNGVRCIDPHVRVVPSHRRFVDIFASGEHPVLAASPQTIVADAPLHFHLKYLRGSPYPNRTLPFLPEKLSAESARPYVRSLPFALPPSVERAVRRLLRCA